MKNYFGLSQSLLMLTASCIAGCVLSASPSRAATFSSSETSLVFTDFSHSASDAFTKTIANSISTSQEGKVEAISDSTAFIETDSSVAINSSFSLANGKSKNYMGMASSSSEIKGIFNIEENTVFSFNFFANLTLSTSIDSYPGENAQASGKVWFALFDVNTNKKLDFFNASSGLTATNDNDFVNYSKQGDITLNYPFAISDFGGWEESSQISVAGFYERNFETQTTLALVAFTNNQVKVSASEPTNQVALLFLSSAIVVGIKSKQRNTLIGSR
ncbi:MAG: hypothetical protein WBA07_04155 [Rivularia sp. (in: cyanobacteria)]